MLYAGDDAYATELLAIIDELIKLILKHLESMSADQSPQVSIGFFHAGIVGR